MQRIRVGFPILVVDPVIRPGQSARDGQPSTDFALFFQLSGRCIAPWTHWTSLGYGHTSLLISEVQVFPNA